MLDSLIATAAPDIQFWRDKSQREVDFVVPRGRDAVDAIECKWSSASFDVRALRAFRQGYRRGTNYLVVPTAVDEPYVRPFDELEVTVIDLPGLRRRYASSRRGRPR